MKRVFIVFLVFVLPCLLAIVSLNIVYNDESDFSVFQSVINNIYGNSENLNSSNDLKIKELVENDIAKYKKGSESIYVSLSDFYIVNSEDYLDLDKIITEISDENGSENVVEDSLSADFIADSVEDSIDNSADESVDGFISDSEDFMDDSENHIDDLDGFVENVDGEDFLNIVIGNLVFQDIISKASKGYYDIDYKIKDDEPYVNVNSLLYKGDYYDLTLDGVVLRYFSDNLPITYQNYINQMCFKENLFELVKIDKTPFSTVFYIRDSFYNFDGKIIIEKDLFGRVKSLDLDLPFIMRDMGNTIRIEG